MGITSVTAALNMLAHVTSRNASTTLLSALIILICSSDACVSNDVVYSIPAHAIPTKSGVCDVFARDDIDELYTVGYDGIVSVWNKSSGQSLRSIKERIKCRPHRTCISSDGRLIAYAEGPLTLRDARLAFNLRAELFLAGLQQNAKVTKVGDLDSALAGLAITRDGTVVATSSYAGQISIWDTQKSLCTDSISINGELYTALSFGSSGAILAGGSSEGRLTVWVRDGLKAKWSMRTDEGEISSLRFATDGARLFVGTTSGNVSCWRTEDGTKVANFVGHTSRVVGIQLTDECERMLTVSGELVRGKGFVDCGARVWNVRLRSVIDHIAYKESWVNCGVFDDKGKRVILGDSAGDVKMWRLSAPEGK